MKHSEHIYFINPRSLVPHAAARGPQPGQPAAPAHGATAEPAAAAAIRPEAAGLRMID